ncbi:MAG TPA: hypothetical protein VGC32_02565 [Solirubrobacterales bacterium]
MTNLLARRRLWLGAIPIFVLAALATLLATGALEAGATTAPGPAPVGIVSAVGYEQAPILAAMKVAKTERIEGYTFYVGTIAGRPVVDVLGYEDDQSAELATYLLATRFHPRALVFSGTGGAQSPRVRVGDVVVGGFVVDKSNVHFQEGGFQSSDKGEQVHVTVPGEVRGDLLGGHGHRVPTPATAKGFGYGPEGYEHRLPYVEAYAATHELVALGDAAAGLGSIPAKAATGEETAGGVIHDRTMVGVMGQAETWTEPLSWIAAQNSLYQSDVEENEGGGFAFAATTTGVPWVMVRGVSDTPWHPAAYQGIVAADHAAHVAIHIATQLPDRIARAPERFGELSPLSNARRAGYLVADKAFYGVGPVRRVAYTAPDGHRHVIAGAALTRLRAAYGPEAAG